MLPPMKWLDQEMSKLCKLLNVPDERLDMEGYWSFMSLTDEELEEMWLQYIGGSAQSTEAS